MRRSAPGNALRSGAATQAVKGGQRYSALGRRARAGGDRGQPGHSAFSRLVTAGRGYQGAAGNQRSA